MRNVLKTHNVILVIGGQGTGKTVTALKAAVGFGNVYYYKGSAPALKQDISMYNDTAKSIDSIAGLDSLNTAEPILIVDDVQGLESRTLDALADMALDPEKIKTWKVVLIAPLLLQAKPFFPAVEVVVRFKRDTAEMLFSGVCDLDRM